MAAEVAPEANELKNQIDQQGLQVRELKTSGKMLLLQLHLFIPRTDIRFFSIDPFFMCG